MREGRVEEGTPRCQLHLLHLPTPSSYFTSPDLELRTRVLGIPLTARISHDQSQGLLTSSSILHLAHLNAILFLPAQHGARSNPITRTPLVPPTPDRKPPPSRTPQHPTNRAPKPQPSTRGFRRTKRKRASNTLTTRSRTTQHIREASSRVRKGKSVVEEDWCVGGCCWCVEGLQ